MVSRVPAPSLSIAPPSSAKSMLRTSLSANSRCAASALTNWSSRLAWNLPPQPVKRKSSNWKPPLARARVIGPESRSQVSSYSASTNRTRCMSTRAERSRASA